jgi:hypothetical protein
VEELDGDLWGYFPDRLLNFVGGIGQAVRVDVDANAATRTLHVFTRFQSPDALFKFMAAVRTLKFDDVGIDIWHRGLSFCFVGSETGPALRTYRLQTAPFSIKASFLRRTSSIGRTGRLLCSKSMDTLIKTLDAASCASEGVSLQCTKKNITCIPRHKLQNE